MTDNPRSKIRIETLTPDQARTIVNLWSHVLDAIELSHQNFLADMNTVFSAKDCEDDAKLLLIEIGLRTLVECLDKTAEVSNAEVLRILGMESVNTKLQ